MYRRAYSDIDRDDFSTERENEAMAFDHAIAMMRLARRKTACPTSCAPISSPSASGR